MKGKRREIRERYLGLAAWKRCDLKLRARMTGRDKARLIAGLGILGLLGLCVSLFVLALTGVGIARAGRLPGEVLGTDQVTFQQGRYDCGAAALGMILKSYGLEDADLKNELLDHPRGTSMLRMKEVAERRGLIAEGWRIAEADIGSIHLPAIALMNKNHYVVLERVEPSHVVYADPAVGRLRIELNEFFKRSNGEMLIFERPR